MHSFRPPHPANEPFRAFARFIVTMKTKTRFPWLLLLCLALPGTSALAQPAVPEALEPWRDWVLAGQEFRACPVFNGRDTAQEANRACAWPSALAIDVDADGARFEQRWRVYREEWIPLPGDGRYWPAAVTVDGETAAVVQRAGRPSVRVPAGEHAVAGVLAWETRPASIPVPAATGLIDLRVDGAAVALPELERGVLWLGLRPEFVVEEDRLSVEVYRKLTDSIPIRLETRIQFDVAGQSRELELTGAQLDGFVGESLTSDLPAELDADGTLRIQIRPGRWATTLIAHHPEMVDSVARAAVAPPWPADEIWSFESNPVLRVAALEGVPAVDSQRAGVPPAWRGLPGFAVDADATVELVERSRNDATGDNRLTLTRYLWLDFDGEGFTAQDRVRGQMQREWRLDMAAPFTLTSAAIGQENLLVTAGEQAGTQGVELRTANLDLLTTARLAATREIPVTGYTSDFDSARTVLLLPPAHRLLAAPGAGTSAGSWLEGWLLLDVFLALIIAVASWRLFGTAGGAIALIALVLTYHEPNAPHYAWLNLLLITALLRVVPGGPLAVWCRRYRYLSLAVLALLLVPFAAMQLRVVVFPQLEHSGLDRNLDPLSDRSFDMAASIANLRGLNSAAGARTLSLVDSRRFVDSVSDETDGRLAQQQRQQEEAAARQEQITVTGTRLRRDDFSSPEATTVVTAEDMRQLGVINSADMIDQLPANAPGADRAFASAGGLGFGANDTDSDGLTTPGRYQPGALIQTGPGLPDWAWTRYALRFDGPIERDERYTLVILGPWLVALWRIAGVAFALGFAWLLLKPGTRLPGLRPRAGRTATVLAGMMALAAAAAPTPGVAQTADAFPSPQLLEELRQRLTRAAPCHPACAELTAARIEVGDTALTAELEIAVEDAVAVPVPGTAQSWRADAVSVDGTAQRWVLSDNAGQAWIRLDQGVHTVRLTGPIPPLDSLALAFPLVPRRIDVNAPGWDVAGVSEGRLLAGAVELIRQRQADDGEDGAIQATAFPPYVRVTRTISFGIDWIATTRVQRLAPQDGAFTLGITLLPEESVVTEAVEVEDGRATVAFAAGQSTVSWQSLLPKTNTLSLTAGEDVPWSESWYLNVGHEWHAEYAGMPSTRTLSAGGLQTLATEYLPRPGETLDITLRRPEAVSGDTIAFDRVARFAAIGARTTDESLDLSYRSTRAGERTIDLPEGAELGEVLIDNRVVPLQVEGTSLTLPILPGRHSIRVSWQKPAGISLLSGVEAVDLGAGASNISLGVSLTGNRWILASFGPALGPAVLYWAELAAFVFAAIVLGRVPLSPLRTHEWLLLGLGLSTFSWPVLLLFAAWAFVTAWRGRHTIGGPPLVFNAAQIGLGLLTLVVLAALVGSIANGLLGAPNMHIVSPVAGELGWFADRSDGPTPSASVLSVPLWFYKAAMLAWALWLSFALLRWLRLAWTAFSFDGVWRGRLSAKPATGA